MQALLIGEFDLRGDNVLGIQPVVEIVKVHCLAVELGDPAVH